MRIIVSILLMLVLSSCNSKNIEWDKASRTFALVNNEGKTLFSECEVKVEFTDSSFITSRDQRYLMSQEIRNKERSVYFKDTRGSLDLNLTYAYLDNLSVTLRLTLINNGDQPVFIHKISSLQGNIVKPDTKKAPKVLITPEDRFSKRIIYNLKDSIQTIGSMYTVALDQPTFAAGFLEGKKHFNHFTITNNENSVTFEAWGEGNGCEIRPGASRTSDLLFMSLKDNSLQQMERFAELAAQQNNASVWPENRAVWCTWYAGWNRETMYTYKNGIAEGIEEQIPYIKKHLLSRGAKTMRVCDDHIAYGDWYDTTMAFPKGFRYTAEVIHNAGLIPGIWYPVYWASTGSDIFKEHPEWFAMEEDGSPYIVKDEFQNRSRLNEPHKFVIFDSSVPEVQHYFENTARRWKESGFEYVTNDFLQFATAPPKYHNPAFSKAEVLRTGLEAVKRGLGNDVFYRTIIGAQYGPAMGISHDMRISGDSHGDKPFAYHRTAAAWFYNHKVWINDPSAIVFMRYGEFRDIEWNKMWVSWIALAGTVMTYGEQLDELPDEYLDVYRKVFPPLKVAGRPLDIWENQPYTMWGMQPENDDDSYCLFGVFDLDGEGKRNTKINLDEVLSTSLGWKEMETAPEKYLLWDFWNEKLIESDAHQLDIPMPEKSCRMFALRKYDGVPQFLGTNGHFSMGAIETDNIKWDTKTNTLTGEAKGNGGDATTLFFYVPKSFILKKATLGLTVIESEIDKKVLKVNIPASITMLPFSIQFEGTSEQVTSRPFVKGVASKRYD